MEKVKHILLGLLVIAIVVVWWFNISLTSLPTTFKAVVDEQIEEDKQLIITELDTERIQMIRIEAPTSSEGEGVIEIDNRDVINALLSSELRIYKGGRFKESTNEYDLYIYFYGSSHSYTIAEDYIRTDDGKYKVLDDENEIFEYLELQFEEGS